MNINFKGYECQLQFGKYMSTDNTAIQLIGAKGTEYENELIGIATSNGEFELVEGVVGIKAWSENEGIVKVLVDGGVIEPNLLGFEPTGFVTIDHYRLTEKAFQEFQKQIKPTSGN